MRKPVPSCFFVLGICVFIGICDARSSSSSGPGDSPGKSPGYVGAETCKSCHDEEYASVSATAHKELFAEREVKKQGCEACHGPGQAHLDGNGDASKIFRFSDARLAAVRTRCGACHQDLSGEAHTQRQTSCLKCHSIHQAKPKDFLLKPDAAQE